VSHGEERPSAEKREANRINAKLSSGPRTRAGKAGRVEMPRKHGLSQVEIRPPALTAELNELAAKLAGLKQMIRWCCPRRSPWRRLSMIFAVSRE
jgi:hypothetical protein